MSGHTQDVWASVPTRRTTMGQSCNACGKRTSKNYVPAGYAGTACKRCAARDTKRAMDALRVGNWNVYRA